MTRSLHTTLALAACAATALLAASAASAHGTASSLAKKLTVYSVATQEQFMNHEDDRDRGKGNNPFGNFQDSVAATKETGIGPFAGDRAIFTFALFDDAKLRTKIGSATFICQYGFSKNAICDAGYQLKSGQLIGEGAFNFNAKGFDLAITGGTGKYAGLIGVMSASPSKGHTQTLTFRLK
jgi:hypothetical protein